MSVHVIYYRIHCSPKHTHLRTHRLACGNRSSRTGCKPSSSASMPASSSRCVLLSLHSLFLFSAQPAGPCPCSKKV